MNGLKIPYTQKIIPHHDVTYSAFFEQKMQHISTIQSKVNVFVSFDSFLWHSYFIFWCAYQYKTSNSVEKTKMLSSKIRSLWTDVLKTKKKSLCRSIFGQKYQTIDGYFYKRIDSLLLICNTSIETWITLGALKKLYDDFLFRRRMSGWMSVTLLWNDNSIAKSKHFIDVFTCQTSQTFFAAKESKNKVSE